LEEDDDAEEEENRSVRVSTLSLATRNMKPDAKTEGRTASGLELVLEVSVGAAV
jgi:hypothetical protein